MALRLRYGNYIHGEGEVALTINREALRNESDAAYAILERWTVNGWIHANTQTELLTKVRALEQAYFREGRDAFLLFPNNQIAHQMISAQALGGVRISQLPSFPEGRGAEWSTYRSYQITLEAEFPTGSAEANLLSWSETVSITGTGGPRRVLVEITNGPPQPQIVTQRTISRMTQTGSATGYLNYPIPPQPLIPQWNLETDQTITRRTPRARNVGLTRRDTEFTVDWSYNFEAPFGLQAFPNRKPRF